ncbi:MAG: hypothetical protein VXZ18_00595 [Pseudomonadota bacterium]|nr:hypothetical protein [Pseudomonadota bacterium]
MAFPANFILGVLAALSLLQFIFLSNGKFLKSGKIFKDAQKIGKNCRSLPAKTTKFNESSKI